MSSSNNNLNDLEYLAPELKGSRLENLINQKISEVAKWQEKIADMDISRNDVEREKYDSNIVHLDGSRNRDATCYCPGFKIQLLSVQAGYKNGNLNHPLIKRGTHKITCLKHYDKIHRPMLVASLKYCEVELDALQGQYSALLLEETGAPSTRDGAKLVQPELFTDDLIKIPVTAEEVLQDGAGYPN